MTINYVDSSRSLERHLKENEYYVESLELICSNDVHCRLESRLYLLKQEVLKGIAREADFECDFP